VLRLVHKYYRLLEDTDRDKPSNLYDAELITAVQAQVTKKNVS